MAVSADDGPVGGAPPPPPPPVAAYPEPVLAAGDEEPAAPEGATAPDATGEPGPPEHLLGRGGGLVVYRPFWRRPWRIVFALLLVVVFSVPLRIGGLWWLTLAVSEALVGILVIAGATAHRRLAVFGATGLALLGAVGLEAYNDVAFGTLSLSGPPPLVFVCGTEYARTTASPIAVGAGAALRRVGTTPSGMALLVNLRCGGPHPVWAFVSSGPGKVVAYLADQYSGSPVPYWR